MNERKKITFDDLSFWLKVAVVFAFIYGTILVGAFLFGFIGGLLG